MQCCDIIFSITDDGNNAGFVTLFALIALNTERLQVDLRFFLRSVSLSVMLCYIDTRPKLRGIKNITQSVRYHLSTLWQLSSLLADRHDLTRAQNCLSRVVTALCLLVLFCFVVETENLKSKKVYSQFING